MEEFKDCIGQNLSIGDYVTYPESRYQGLELDRIIGFTPKMVKLTRNTIRYSGYLLKIEGSAISAYMAEKGRA